MPVSFTLFSPATILILVGCIMAVNLVKKALGNHTHH
jgi:hypothetical protein